MANTKISALTALAGTAVEQAADVLPIVDNSVTTTKKILVSELGASMYPLATEVASTSGSTIDFTSIPAWAKRITMNLVGVSTNGVSPLLVQLGDSGGVETSGYTSSVVEMVSAGSAGSTSTAGFLLHTVAEAAAAYTATIVVNMENLASFRWVATSVMIKTSEGRISFCAGSKATSAALDRIRLTMVSGADTFDAGVVNITYE